MKGEAREVFIHSEAESEALGAAFRIQYGTCSFPRGPFLAGLQIEPKDVRLTL